MNASPACVVSDVGRRDSNQDRACAENTTIGGKPALLMALADGMGGMSAGDRAAELAIDTVREYAARVLPGVANAPEAIAAALVRMFQDANRRIWERSRRDGCSDQMGSTLVCCLVFDNRFLVANAGDSRCYYINDHDVRLLTEDHSQVQEMVRRGVMTQEAARRSPYRNQLTNCLGEPHDVRVDVFPSADRCGVIDEPCVLMLSSDGLHSHVSAEDVLRHIRSTGSVAQACAALVTLALEQGSTDNVSVVAVEQGRLRRHAVRPVEMPIAKTVRGPITVKLQMPPRRRRRVQRRTVLAVALAAFAVGGASAIWLYPRVASDLFPFLKSRVQGVLHRAGPGAAAGTAGRSGQDDAAVAPVSGQQQVSADSGKPDSVSPPTALVEQKPSEPVQAKPGGAEAATFQSWNAGLTCEVTGSRLLCRWKALEGLKEGLTFRVQVAGDPDFGGKLLHESAWLKGTVYQFQLRLQRRMPVYARVVVRQPDGRDRISETFRVEPAPVAGRRAGRRSD